MDFTIFQKNITGKTISMPITFASLPCEDALSYQNRMCRAKGGPLPPGRDIFFVFAMVP
jgi:hypothetical protein